MKRMKFYIMATCLGIMIGILIITGLYNIIFLNTNFFTYEGIVEAVLAPLVYLFFVWIETRPGNKLLTYIVLFMILLLAICAIGEKTNIFDSLSWRSTGIFIFGMLSSKCANYQSELLLKEEEEDKNSE